jgi:hypothetical protein
MPNKNLHIISFDVPYPADYGGVIDVYYKIKALHAQGIGVYLHCFEYGRAHAKELNTICEKVYYYKRNMQKTQLLSSVPYIVLSRSSEQMMKNLLKDDYPILFEGLHTCYYLNDDRITNRLKIVRSHNIEHHYYKGLESIEKTALRKFYFGEEAYKLQQFERILHQADFIIAISKADTNELASRYNLVHFVGAFHPNNEVKITKGLGDYCLFHGNLSVGENNEAALFLVNTVFSETTIPFIIAGKQPSKELVKAVAKHSHIQLKENVDEATMQHLIQNAQIHVLPCFQPAGIKLKLLTALFNGRHCIVNATMVANTGLEKLCSVKNTADEMIQEIERLFKKPIDTASTKQKRESLLLKDFSNEENARKIIHLI